MAALVIFSVVSHALSGSGSGSGAPGNPTSTPPSTGTVVYQDDFSDPNSGWEKAGGQEDGGKYTSGTYHIYSRMHSSTRGKGPNNSRVFPNAPQNVSVAADGHKIFNNPLTSYGLGCRADLTSFGYVFVLGDGYAAIDKISPDVPGFFSQMTSPALSGVNSARSNHLEASCTTTADGKAVHLVFWVNGHKVAEAIDRNKPLLNGSVGLIVGIGTNTVNFVEAEFDNFVVRQL